MVDDDAAAERARLEALAWGGSASESEAAAARLALEQLGPGRRRLAAGPVRADQPGGAPRVRPTVPSSGRSAPRPLAGSAASALQAAPLSPDRTPTGGAGAARPGDLVESPGGIDGESAPTGTAPAASAEDSTGHAPDATDDDGAAPSLQDGQPDLRTRARRVLATTRPRVWIALGLAAAVGLAFVAGTVVGTARTDQAAAPSVTPSAGAVTLEELLDAPQTYADQLPGPVEAPVSLHSTRLIYSNRALDGGSFATPWTAWAAVGTDRSTICIIATANRIESTSACYPRNDALHGSVSLSTESLSGSLTLNIRGGGVQGTVTNAAD